MLRAYDRAGGIGIYSRNIVKHLLMIDADNEYVLMYDSKDHLGTYSHLENVEEIYIPPANPLIWDHWKVHQGLQKSHIDLVFHTKFTVPLFMKTKRVMTLHGAGWFVHPQLWGKLNVQYQKAVIPMYCRAADFLISNSELTTKAYVDIFKIPPHKIRTTHLAAGNAFHQVTDAAALEAIRKAYRLPEKFILTVTSYDPLRKNFATLLEAFEQCRRTHDVDLVVVGSHCEKYAQDFDFRSRGLHEVVHFPGWVEQSDLPAIYSLAQVFFFPSVYETFGIPVVEAMSCGCPVVSSNTGAIPELAHGAALLSDPFDRDVLAANLSRVLSSQDVARHYHDAGLKRAEQFSWDRTARETLEVFQLVMSGPLHGVDHS
jgi:glycosyltransferase involved in cell wall biosynthesis